MYIIWTHSRRLPVAQRSYECPSVKEVVRKVEEDAAPNGEAEELKCLMLRDPTSDAQSSIDVDKEEF